MTELPFLLFLLSLLLQNYHVGLELKRPHTCNCELCPFVNRHQICAILSTSVGILFSCGTLLGSETGANIFLGHDRERDTVSLKEQL